MAAKFPAITYITKAFAAGDTTFTIGELPENARVVDAGAWVETAFDGTTPVLDIGTAADTDGFATDLDVSAVGLKKADELATSDDLVVGATPVGVRGVLADGSSTVGKGTAFVAYIIV